MLHSQRETQISRFRAWVLFLVPLAAILFQVYVPLFFQFLAYLELPLLVTVYFALMRRSPIGGLLVGALVGLAQDSLSKNPLGMFGITKTLVGYFAASVGLAARRRPSADPADPGLLLLMSSTSSSSGCCPAGCWASKSASKRSAPWCWAAERHGGGVRCFTFWIN